MSIQDTINEWRKRASEPQAISDRALAAAIAREEMRVRLITDISNRVLAEWKSVALDAAGDRFALRTLEYLRDLMNAEPEEVAS